MPETKINVGSPFVESVSESGIDSAEVKIWIYTGDKDQELGDATYTLYRDAPTGADEVRFYLDQLIKDYLQPSVATPLNDNVDYVRWVKIQTSSLTDTPTASDVTVYTTTSTPVIFNLEGSDPKYRPLTYSVVTAPTNGSISNTNNQFTYTSNPLFTGTDTIVYKVNNGIEDSANATVTINVAAVQNGILASTLLHSGTSIADAAENARDGSNLVSNTLYYDGNDVSGLSRYSLREAGLFLLEKRVYSNSSKTVIYPNGYYAAWYYQPYQSGDDLVAAFRVMNGRIVERNLSSE